jgi:hypothetical protein
MLLLEFGTTLACERTIQCHLLYLQRDPTSACERTRRRRRRRRLLFGIIGEIGH